ncbi:MAG: class I SAM-dependent methyltransferase [Leptolyngbya sp.]|nr:class I SAM-dependent methyltransferase [Candidatus Melainabacteria bacterium]
MSETDEPKSSHKVEQTDYFKTRVAVFLAPIPAEILGRTEKIALSVGLTQNTKILDVGTGTGALIAHFLGASVKPENIVGLDLTDAMLENARARFPKVHFICGDVLEVDKVVEGQPVHVLRQYDAVFFNACFGNLFDQQLALEKTSKLLRENGSIVISHPLGSRFVKSLHESDPSIVPFSLPDRMQLDSWAKLLNLKVAEFTDEKDFYLARLQK